MNKNLIDYVKVYSGAISAEHCNAAIEQLTLAEWQDHKFYSANGLVDNGHEPLEYHGVIPVSPVLQQSVWDCLYRYVITDINFSWFPGWHHTGPLKYIRYDVNSTMENHCDHIGSVHGGIPVLTTIINLNDTYTGGELIMFEDTEYKLQQGDVIVFPSVFLYPHQIKPILSGTRYSAIAWSS